MNKGKWGHEEWLSYFKKTLHTAKREIKEPDKFNLLCSNLSKLAEDNIKPWNGTTGIGDSHPNILNHGNT